MRKYERLSPEKRKKFFKNSAGIIHEDLISRLSSWSSTYVSQRFILNNTDFDARNFFVRRLGEYGIRNVYMHYVVKLAREVVRRGGLQMAGDVVHKLGWVLNKIGFFQKNPIDVSNGFLKKQLISLELLTEGQDMKELLVYPAAACPGAFARAVTKVITKQKIAVVLAKEPRFIASLNAMAGVSVYDLMSRMAMNFMTLQEMSARVVLIKNAVDPKDWARILNAFLNEAVAEIFFDRKHAICRQFTEGIIGWMSSPVLKRLYDATLPSEPVFKAV
jgi:ethanolamine utilization protein EutP (predicted NTPase)